MTTTPIDPHRSELAERLVEIGEERGEARAKSDAVVAVLGARGVPISASAVARAAACTDLTQLDEWVRRAATAESADDLFA